MQQRSRRSCWQSCPSSRQGLCQRRSGYTYCSLLDEFKGVHNCTFAIVLCSYVQFLKASVIRLSGAQKETACLQILDAPTLPPITKSTPQLPEFQVQLLTIGYYLNYFLYKIFHPHIKHNVQTPVLPMNPDS